MKITQAHLYFTKRLGYIVVTLFVISVIVFMATVMLPGSAARLILGRQATPEKVAQLEREMGLDQPPHVQYIDWLTNLLSGDAGTSLVFNEPVVSLVLPRAHVSLQLALVTLVVVSLLGIPLLPEVGLILVFGLSADLMNTYMLNVSLLRYYKYEAVRS